MSDDGFAVMRRDASFYRNPGRATKYHVPAVNQGALCDKSILLNEETASPANQVSGHVVCCRCLNIRARAAAALSRDTKENEGNA